MKEDILTSEICEALLKEAQQLNPGPWVPHSRFVASAAKNIAQADADLDHEVAYCFGMLHDIGRRFGVTSLRHALDGYTYLVEQGLNDAARICMTHSLPLQDTDAIFGEWDCSPEERRFVDEYIASITYDAYDRLLQLCDALALPTGYVLLEKRMMDVALRHGTNRLTVAKWKATFGIQVEFEGRIGKSIYEVLPGVIENTFEMKQNE